ncbi:serine protease [Xanthobacter sp. V2C-8]|uniref:S1C family serine protease n=1 Tax=Xanthobacter albus TaxID=3119929 RepID=UPI0037262C5A
MKLVALFSALSLLATSSSAQARVLRSETVSGWDVTAETSDDGSFLGCFAGADYKSGHTLQFAVLKGGDWAFVVSGPNIRLPDKKFVTVSLRVGGGRLWTLEGKSTRRGIFAIVSGANEQLFEELRIGYLLRVYFLDNEVPFNLDGTASMLNYISSCAGYYAGLEQDGSPFAGTVNAASPAAGGDVPTSRLSEQQARSAVVPYVRAATDCIAEQMANDPRFDSFASEGRVMSLMLDAAKVCQPKLNAMVSAHDRHYYPGKGKEFLAGPYAEDLPRALNERLKPRIESAVARGQDVARRGASPIVAPPPSEAPQHQNPAPKVGTSFGSGFFVRYDGTGLTNAHVVEGCRSAVIEGYGEARIMARDKTNDLALLQPIGGLRTGAAQFSKRAVKLGEFIYVLGFPLSTFVANGLNFTGGSVSSLSGIDGDSRQMQMSAPIQPGNSGGPVVNTSAQLVGITVSHLNEFAALEKSGSLPQNMNYAIRSDIAASFLRANGIEPLEAEPTSKLAPEEIAAAGREFTFQVKCKVE